MDMVATDTNCHDVVPHKTKSIPNGCLNHFGTQIGDIRQIPNNATKVTQIKENNVGIINEDNDSIDKTLAQSSNENESLVSDNDLESNPPVKDLPNSAEDHSCSQERCTCSEAVAESNENATSLSDALAEVCLSEAQQESSAIYETKSGGIEYVVYQSELQMPDIMRLITKDLSEPYSIYTYRYFIHNWPKLCFLAKDEDKCIGAIVCKLDLHKKMVRRGYIAMLAIDNEYRRRGIGSHLVMKAIKAMVADDCDEVVLETEITNKAALRLYENLGFVRDKRLFRYYLNGVDALRLKLWLR